MAVRAAVLFDLDGVIIDSEELQYRAYQHILAPFGVQVTREEYGREWIGNGCGPEYVVRTYQLPVEPDELRRRRSSVYFDLLQQGIMLMPGVAPALVRLGARFPLAVATNSNQRDTVFVLERLQIAQHFTAVVTREMYERAKPEPDAFLTAAARIGVPPEQCVVIEDAYKGVMSAVRAGCKCIAIPHDFTRGNDLSAAALMLNHLDEVTVELVERLTSDE